jgi:3',5'-cyclic AMP phosphodiesterase CpdA
LATGYFKARQAEKLSLLLATERSAGQCCVVLIHHPPQANATHRHKRLLGAKRFRNVIAKSGADLILHGHTHLATTAFINGPVKKVPVICVPAAYQWPGHRKPPSGLNMFSISKDGTNWKIALERHGLASTSPSSFELLETVML